MDEDVRKKTISHMTKILYRQADFLNHANSQEMINGYMKTRFFQLVSMIYPMLIIGRQDINFEEIDEKIKEINPAIYERFLYWNLIADYGHSSTLIIGEIITRLSCGLSCPAMK